jgi:hypothetical protein
MAVERYIIPSKVEQIAGSFEQFGSTLKTVAQVLENLIRILDTTAFIGLVGGAVIARYLEQLQPQIEQLAKLCEELSEDAMREVRQAREAGNFG